MMEDDAEKLKMVDSQLNFNFCRFCMVTVKKRYSRELPEYFYTKFREISSGVELSRSNEFPTRICNSCYDQFYGIQSFVESVLETQEKIRNLIDKKNMKIKVNDLKNQNPSSQLKLYQEIMVGHDSKFKLNEIIIKTEPNDDNYETEMNFGIEPDLTSAINFEMKMKYESSTDEERRGANQPKSEFFCDYCEFKTFKKLAIAAHMRKHTQINKEKATKVKIEKIPTKCDKCSRIFVSQISAERHKIKVHRIGKVNCDICDSKFDDVTRLRLHKKKFHEEKVICSLCGELTVPFLMQRHIKECHTPCSCKFCGREYNNEYRCRKHEKDVHTFSEVVCDFCGTSFKNKRRLLIHKKRQHRVDKIFCPIMGCSYSHTRRQYVRMHLNNHRDVDDYEKNLLLNEIKKLQRPLPTYSTPTTNNSSGIQ